MEDGLRRDARFLGDGSLQVGELFFRGKKGGALTGQKKESEVVSPGESEGHRHFG